MHEDLVRPIAIKPSEIKFSFDSMSISTVFEHGEPIPKNIPVITSKIVELGRKKDKGFKLF